MKEEIDELTEIIGTKMLTACSNYYSTTCRIALAAIFSTYGHDLKTEIEQLNDIIGTKMLPVCAFPNFETDDCTNAID